MAAIKLVDYIVHQIDRKLTLVNNIYIDLLKAFDTLNFYIFIIETTLLWNNRYSTKKLYVKQKTIC